MKQGLLLLLITPFIAFAQDDVRKADAKILEMRANTQRIRDSKRQVEDVSDNLARLKQAMALTNVMSKETVEGLDTMIKQVDTAGAKHLHKAVTSMADAEAGNSKFHVGQAKTSQGEAIKTMQQVRREIGKASAKESAEARLQALIEDLTKLNEETVEQNDQKQTGTVTPKDELDRMSEEQDRMGDEIDILIDEMSILGKHELTKAESALAHAAADDLEETFFEKADLKQKEILEKLKKASESMGMQNQDQQNQDNQSQDQKDLEQQAQKAEDLSKQAQDKEQLQQNQQYNEAMANHFEMQQRQSMSKSDVQKKMQQAQQSMQNGEMEKAAEQYRQAAAMLGEEKGEEGDMPSMATSSDSKEDPDTFQEMNFRSNKLALGAARRGSRSWATELTAKDSQKLQSLLNESPEEYRDLVKDYYKALSRSSR